MRCEYSPVYVPESADMLTFHRWAMTISLFYFTFWLCMRGASVVRPSALQRGYANLWMFFFGWIVQVFAAVAEDRLHLSVLYTTVFLQTAVFISTLLSLLELFALPSKHDFARGLHDEHHERDLIGRDGAGSPTDQSAQQDRDRDEDDETEPSETTPLRSADGGGSRTTSTFGAAYRQSVSRDAEARINARKYQPFPYEQSWSGRLPTWTWIIQFLLLAPVPLILQGNLALIFSTALSMTGTDGSSLLLPILMPAVLSIVLLLPLAPFAHRITHHVPTFLLLVFLGTFIYNLAAFPFSINHRFKFFFQQVIDLDDKTNYCTLTGLEDYIRPVIASLPSASGTEPECFPYKPRGLTSCRYDASSLRPNLVDGKDLDELITVSVPETSDGLTTEIVVDALETRMCSLAFNKPIFGFSVEGGSDRDPRFGSLPEDGFESINLWRRTWDGAWNVTVQLKPHGQNSAGDAPAIEGIEAIDHEDLRMREKSNRDTKEDPLRVLVSCAYSDANKPSTIPAMHELNRYMPTWATLTKGSTGLVEIWKRFDLPS